MTNAQRSKRARDKAKATGHCTACFQPLEDLSFKKCLPCRDNNKLSCKVANLNLKIQVMIRLGGCCICCGVTQLDFLSVDHVNEDGAKHRRELFKKHRYGGGYKFWKWLIQNNFPDGFQVMCLNCNFSKHLHRGQCIHQLCKD